MFTMCTPAIFKWSFYSCLIFSSLLRFVLVFFLFLVVVVVVFVVVVVVDCFYIPLFSTFEQTHCVRILFVNNVVEKVEIL